MYGGYVSLLRAEERGARHREGSDMPTMHQESPTASVGVEFQERCDPPPLVGGERPSQFMAIRRQNRFFVLLSSRRPQ